MNLTVTKIKENIAKLYNKNRAGMLNVGAFVLGENFSAQTLHQIFKII